MTTLREFHHEAMRLADEAHAADRRGDHSEAQRRFFAAYEHDQQAVQFVADRYDSEPTRSILYSSAASLAYQCGQYREAERMICFALAGNPPDAIANELRDLLEKVNFGRHLELRGAALASSELRMSIAGKAVSFGVAPSDAFTQRIQFVVKLLIRTTERLNKLDFRTGGPIKKFIREQYTPFVAVLEPGSFAVTFRLGEPNEQLSFDGHGFTAGASVVNEVMSCLDLFDAARQDDLRTHIDDAYYYNNFVALARQVAPDGSEISMVGFTASGSGPECMVNLVRTRDFLVPVATEANTERKVLGTSIIKGQLRAATSQDPLKEAITIIDSNLRAHRVIVPSGVGDIVRPYWDEEVVATVVKIKERSISFLLQDIRKSEDEDAEVLVA